METLKIRSISGQAKIIGTLLSISGALVAVLYEGPILIDTEDKAHYKLSLPILSSNPAQSQWILGGALLSASYIVLSIWDTAQVYTTFVLNDSDAL